MHYHNTATQSRSAWTEQEDELLRQAVAKFGDRAWATVANDVPGRSSKSCSDRWRNFLSPDIEHPRKSPFTEWEVAVVVLAQTRYGNNWKAISMLLPGRTNRAVKNLFVGNLKWGARLNEIRNRWLECNMSLEELLEIKPDHAGGAVKLKPGMNFPTASGSPSSFRAASTSSAGSAWASDITDQPLSGSPGSSGTRRRGDGTEMHAGQSPSTSKRRRGVPSPVMIPHHYQHPSSASYSPNVVPHPGALGPGLTGSPVLAGLPASFSCLGSSGCMGPPGARSMGVSTPTLTLTANNTGALVQVKQRVSSNGSGEALLMPGMQVMDDSPQTLTPGGAFGAYGNHGAASGCSSSMSCTTGISGMLVPGQQGVAALMVNRMHSWHAGAMTPPGIDIAAAAAAAGNGSNSPFAAMAGNAMLSPASRGMSHLNPLRGFLKAEQGVEGLDCSPPGAYTNMQQHDGCWSVDSTQQNLGQYQQQEQQHAAHQQAAQFQQPSQHQQDMQQCQQDTPAAVPTQLPAEGGLQGLGSPPSLLQDMRSNDSAAFQQMLEQIFDETEDDIISDPQTMHRLDGMIVSQRPPHPSAQQQQPTAQQVSQQFIDNEQVAPAGLDNSSAVPHRSNTWPNSWPNVAADVQPAPVVAPSAASYSTSAPTSMLASPHPSGAPVLPPRSISATGSGLCPGVAPINASMEQQHWGWSQSAPPSTAGMSGMPGAQSMPNSVPGSGPPSSGGFLPQHDMQALCHQLHQENIKLMAHVSKLQHRLNSHPTEVPNPGEMGICVDADVRSMVVSQPDSELPRLPPVRVGTSAGGAATAAGSSVAAAVSGWATGVLANEGSAGLGVAGSGGLGALGVDLSPDGTFTPGTLLGDAHDGDLLQGI